MVVWCSSGSEKVNAAGSGATFAHLPFPNQLPRQVTTLGQPVVCTSPLMICDRRDRGLTASRKGCVRPAFRPGSPKLTPPCSFASLGTQWGLPQKEGRKTLFDVSLNSQTCVLNYTHVRVCVIMRVRTVKLIVHTFHSLYPDPLKGAEAGPRARGKQFSTFREYSELRL